MARRSRIPISHIRLAILYSEQNGCCAGCSSHSARTCTWDHVEPLARSGLDVFENCQLLHSDCNQAKGALSAAEWFQRIWENVGR